MLQTKTKYHTAQAISELEDVLFSQIESAERSCYEPSGLQEEIIWSFGLNKWEIILCLHPNDIGKTTAGAQILKNLIWPHDSKWFSWWKGYSLFKDRQFQLKQFRITAQHTNLIETGAIQTEIKRWWPKGRYEWTKGGQHFPSQCTTDTGWCGDALSYNQSREEHEAKKISILWGDEPPDPNLIGAMTSRFSEGMLWLLTMTPIKCGAFLDIIKDMEDAGTKVKRITGTAYENSITSGKQNHLGTKRGLRTDAEIQSKIARCPLDERDARIFGKASTKSGKIYPDFNRDIHVKYFDLGRPEVKLWNCFMSFDPHKKYYPFLQWWSILPGEIFVCYNEWPTYEMFGAFYDEVRDTTECKMTPEMISNFIKILDGTDRGFPPITERYLDPYYGLGFNINSGGETESLATLYVPYGVILSLPPRQLIEVQRQEIHRLMKYDPQMPISIVNEPQMYWMPHCVNSIRMMERHCWDEEGERENLRFKEGPDCTRIFLAGWGNRGYRPPNESKTQVIQNKNEVNELVKNLSNISLG